MRVDLHALGTFSRTGTAGAEHAAESLAALTGAEVHVNATQTNFVPKSSFDDIATNADHRVGIDFTGGLAGRAVLEFDDESAAFVLAALGDPDATEYLQELANVMTSSYIDGFATYLDATIDISPPTVMDTDDAILQPADTIDDCGFLFESDLEFTGTTHGCSFYMTPTPDSFLDVVRTEDPDAEGVGVDELATFLRLTAAGANTVAENLTQLTGIETDVSVSYLDFVPVENVPSVLADGQYVGAAFEFTGPPDGYLALFFDETGAENVAAALLPDGTEDDAMRESAISELGNITASGFVDGWAIALGTTIDISTPGYFRDLGSAVLDSIAAQLGAGQEFAYVFDVTVTGETDLGCRICAFPEEGGLRTALTDVDTDLDVSTIERL